MRLSMDRERIMSGKINVLILSAGRRVELVQAFQQALRRHFPGRVFTTDSNPELSAACHISDDSFKAPRVTSPEYMEFLLDLCHAKKIGIVIPTIDTELLVLSNNLSRFKDAGVNLVISDPDLVTACRDKRLTAELFTKLGVDQPTIYERDALTFPCFCKPYDGSCSIGAKAILSAEMLSNELLDDNKNIFMELIGKNFSEYTADVYYTDSGRLCCLVPRERIEVRGGEVSKGATRRDFVYYYLLEKFRNLKGARGCITIQVFFNPETQAIKALELNPRFGGGYPLAHIAGADYPEFLVREYLLKEDIEFYDSWENDLLMLRYDAKVIVHANNQS
jgi:carbamoyl-phosphate synthase large subunit